MKKGIAFVLAAVMCLGFVGCGEKAGSAKSIYNELEKVGKLSLEAERYNVERRFSEEKIKILEQITFRLPEEKRIEDAENICSIEVYASAEDAENATADPYRFVYSSGNALLRIDGYIEKNIADRYAEAFQKATGKEVTWVEDKIRYNQGFGTSTFTPRNGIGAREVYNAFKNEIKDIELINFYHYDTGERVDFKDLSQGGPYGDTIAIHVRSFDLDEEEEADSEIECIIRGNIGIYFLQKFPNERIAEYAKVLDELLK